MRAVGAFVLAVWLASLFGQPALAEKRVALVMGNSAYQNVSRLANPVNDSEAMSATFKRAGFDVVDLKRDLRANEMRRALRDFSDNVRDSDIAIVYFAGHGIEIDGTNYLIPVDAALERDIDAFDEAIPLDRLLTVIEPAKQLRLVILDACRDNPFNKTMRRTIGSRAIGRGLAKVEPASPNTLIAFAAKAGSTATDGDSKNSPFTTALVKYLPKPGLDIRKAFGFTRDDVLKVTNNKQEPFIYGSLGGDDVVLVPVLAVPPLTTSPSDPNAAVRRDYELAERIGTMPVWDSFIKNYPSGFYADLAKAQRDKLNAEAASTAATEKAKAAVEEQKRLAIEGAKSAEQAKAAVQAQAAEFARVAAERKKAIEEARVVEAERAKAAAQAKAAEAARVAADKQNALEGAKAAEAERAKVTTPAKSADERNARDDKLIGQLAALAPPDHAGGATPKSGQPTVADIPRLLQIELRRVGCNTGTIDGNWNAAAQRSLGLFNKSAGTKFDVKVASLDALDAVRSKPTRICPLICEHGYKADGDNCSKITCKAGFEVGDDNSCEKIEPKRPAGKQDAASPANPQRPATSSAPPRDSSPRLESESPRTQGGGSCSQMKDPVGCNCALKTGGYIYAGTGHYPGYRFR
jgi:uncharacterized caspase-like protein